MNVTTAIQRAYLEAVGKATSPTVGTDKYNRLLGLADDLQKTWESEQGVDWSSRYELVSLGTITATATFELDDTIRKLSQQEGDPVTITNGTRLYYYNLVSPQQLKLKARSYNMATRTAGSFNVCARIGTSLVFPAAFASTDQQFGGSLVVPAYTYVDDIVRGSDTIQVDDPLWLVYMMAAEYVRNDTVKQGQYANLVAKANDRMEAMKANNGAQLDEIPNLMDSRYSGVTWDA